MILFVGHVEHTSIYFASALLVTMDTYTFGLLL